MLAIKPIKTTTKIRFFNDNPPPTYLPLPYICKRSSTKPKIEAAAKVNNGSHVWLLDKKLNWAKTVSGKIKESKKSKKIMIKIVTHISNPPSLGVPTSFSLCRELNTTASSPVIAFWRADFFQSFRLYKKFVSRGVQKIANPQANVKIVKIFITFSSMSVINLIT